MAKDIDSELATNIKAAKNKRMYFAFVAKGSSDGALVLSKTKVPPALITDAKKKSGGTQVFKGACFGEDGKLVFELAKEPPATMDAALKKVVQRDAGLTQACVCRVGTNPDLADDGGTADAPVGAATPTAGVAEPSAAPAAAQPASLYSKYSTYESTLQPLLVKALKEKTGDTEKLKSVFGYARDQAAKKDYAKAIQGLGALDTLLKSYYSAYGANAVTTPAGGVAPAPAVSPEVLAQAKLKPERIDTEWARGIDLDKCKVKFAADAPQGAFGRLGFVESSDPGAPPLVIKVPLAESAAAELQKEVEFYTQVGEHPNFPKCLGIADIDGQRGLVMEAIKGRDMGKTMNKLKDQYSSGKLSHEQYWGAVQHTVRQTLEAITHLESVGVVHNDIRMDNIMCDEATGQMKVLDFGISVQAGQATSKSPIGYGTVSPDIAARDERGTRTGKAGAVTAKHDVFSVGAAAFAAGEKQVFDYGLGTFDALKKFGDVDAAGKSQQAINPADEQNPAFKKDPEGNARHVAGRAGASTAYTTFINRLMDPDPKKRLSPADALKDPFLADSLMDEEQARGVFKKLLAPEPAPTAGVASGPAVETPTVPDSAYASYKSI